MIVSQFDFISNIIERDEPTRSDSFKLKSRPRPGTLSTVQPNPIIAPPPSSQRKSTTTILGGKQNDGPDLISFTSPPSNNKLINFHQDIQRLVSYTYIVFI